MDAPKEEDDWPTFLPEGIAWERPQNLPIDTWVKYLWDVVDYCGGEDPQRTTNGEAQAVKAAEDWIAQPARMVASCIGVTITNVLGKGIMLTIFTQWFGIVIGRK